MKVGELNRRVTLQKNTVEWQDVVTVWAAVDPLSVQATIAARQADQPYTHKITIRYRDGVSTDMRVIYKRKVFEISAVIDKEESHRFLQLLCVELQIADAQMSQTCQIEPCTGYGRHSPEYGAPVATRCRINRQAASKDATGFFPVNTTIKSGDRVICDGHVYIVQHVAEDRGIANTAHKEVGLRGLSD
ncbi:phage head closure protein [Tumebacillus permanentifrigoris]|uniref:SPP1 family predicted phage head-tail adaptor n=1 Tax=Tumebacillus permanentifrigoris TaxID=378543 RepID=A0A316D596_9BACL|nr:phage head closure protein [Tumebacillus permanentifrigoris]PWK05305.1 SPP1 family predicted phage head-tail adaptor [Tumebacillus permanentifrigoris]